MTPFQVDCFLAVLKSGNLAAAAKTLYISPQAASSHIAQLEEELGVTLFSRSRAGMELTEDGLVFYDYAIRWAGLYDRTMKSIHELYDNLSQRFSIGLSDYIDAVGKISGGISDFAHAHDATNIRCAQKTNAELLHDLATGELDIALTCSSQMIPLAEYGMEPVAEEDLRLYISGVQNLPADLKPDSPELQAVFQALPPRQHPLRPLPQPL